MDAASSGALEGIESPTLRYRCNGCGNITRFDVVVALRTRSFHHYSVGGELTVESIEVLDERVEDVACRWCGHGKAVAAVGRHLFGGSGDLAQEQGLP